MARTRTKPQKAPAPAVDANGSAGEVLTLAEAAAYLRLPEDVVVRLVHQQDLPGRYAGTEWRFFKTAIQQWLSQPVTAKAPAKKDFWESQLGAFKDDPQLEEIVKEAHRRRGRPATKEG
jgi:excisionase family DNA binding protein